MIIYRPTQVQDYSRCEQYGYYRHARRLRPIRETWSPPMLNGTALHAASAAHWRGGNAELALLATFELFWPTDERALVYDRRQEETHVLACWRQLRGVFETHSAFAAPFLGAEIAIEEVQGIPCPGTTDLILQPPGALRIFDLKYHHLVEPRNRHHRMEGLDRNHQFLHYCWAWSRKLDLPVDRFYKVAIFGHPTIEVRLAFFEPTPSMIAAWYRHASEKWARIADILERGRPTRREEGCRPYGAKYPCPYEAACFKYYDDPELMALEYEEVPDDE